MRRDPRWTPQVGDVLVKNKQRRYVHDVNRYRRVVCLTGDSRYTFYSGCVMPTLAQWRKWAENAEVISMAGG